MPGIGNLDPSTLAAGAYPGVVIAEGSVDSTPYRVQIKEIRGRRGKNSLGVDSATREWVVRGTHDPLLARHGLVEGPEPINQYDDLYLRDLEHSVYRKTNDAWLFKATYDNETPNLASGYYVTNIDTTGASILQTYGYADNTGFPATGESLETHGRALNVQDGQPRGVTRIIPALKITVTARIATEYVVRRMLYAKLCARLTGFVNSTGMFAYGSGQFEFAAGELLFAGVRGTIVDKNPQLAFDFLASENVNFSIGTILNIAKQGHQTLWYQFREDKDTITNRRTSKVTGAVVGQVYQDADLNQLKIGVLPTS